MPTYEYRCDKCKTEFEAWQGINDDALTECTACGASGVRRLISSGGGIVFKGPGFYATDYRSKPGGSSGKVDASDKPSGEKAAKSEPKSKSSDD